MRVTYALIKKDILGYFNNVKKSFKTSTLSAFMNLLSDVIFMALFVYIIMRVTMSYSNVMYEGVKDPFQRQYELLAYFYALVMVVTIASSVRQFNKFLFFNDDLKIYITLPIKMSSLFTSIMFFIYIKQFVSTLIYTIIINVIFVYVTKASLNMIGLSLLVAIFLPIISIAIASIIAVPIYYVETTFRNKYVFTLICITAVVGVCFYLYSEVLNIFSDMLFTNEIQFFFSKDIMDKIILIANNLYPAVFFSKISLGFEVGKNIGIIIGITVGAFLLGSILINTMLTSVIKNKLQPKEKVWIKRQHTFNTKSKVATLLNKELVTTLRTPSYLFQYFATALIMPLMTIACVKLCDEFLKNMIGVSCVFEISIFCVFIFNMITNTYSSTNISREGDAFYILKSYPIKPKQFVMVKVLFCFLMSSFATLISCIVLAATKYITPVQAVFVCFSGWAFGLSLICFATHLDLSHPHFSKEDNGEIKENNSTSSLVSIVALFVAVLIGGASLVIRIVLGLKGVESSQIYAYLITGIASLLFCIISTISLWVSIDKLYMRVQEGR